MLRTTDGDIHARIDRLRTAANDATKHLVTPFTSFLLITVYLLITVASTTDEQLLRESSLPLPLLGVGLPIKPFYRLTPCVYVLLHAHLVVQFYLLACVLADLDSAIRELPFTKRAEHRREIDPFPFSHAWLRSSESWRVRFLLRLAVWLTLIALPMIVLCTFQRQFLPYHDAVITWIHRVCVLADLGLLWAIWPLIRTPRRRRHGLSRLLAIDRLRWRRVMRFGRIVLQAWKTPAAAVMELVTIARFVQRAFRRLTLPVGGSLLIVLFTVLAATVPDDWIDRNIIAKWPAMSGYQHAAFFGKAIHRNLVVKGRSLVAREPPPELLAAYVRNGKAEDDSLDAVRLANTDGLDLTDRDLRYADFSGSRLINAKFQNSNLEHAVLPKTDLRGARFVGDGTTTIRLAGTNLRGARLEGLDLTEADLERSDLSYARLQRATLKYANLRGAMLRKTQLEEADLEESRLHGASMWEAYLHGTNLEGAELYAADLTSAELYGTKLANARLHVAILVGARLLCTDLRAAHLHGTDWQAATLRGVDLTFADAGRRHGLSGAKLVEFCDLRRISCDALKVAEAQAIRTAIEHVFPSDERNEPLDRVMSATCTDVEIQCEFKDSQFVDNCCEESGLSVACPQLAAKCHELPPDKLAQLGCTNPWAWRALAARAEEMQRTGATKLACELLALLDDPGQCPAIRGFPDETKVELRKILQCTHPPRG